MASIGDTFVVSQETEIKTESGHRILANYLVGFEYRVTPRNLDIVNDLESKRIATVSPGSLSPRQRRRGGFEIVSGESGARGFINTGVRERQTITPANVGTLKINGEN
jgi:hypothetical protein